jgi:hypothetical protein
MDGYAPASDSVDPTEAQWVHSTYQMHNNGTVGRAYMGLPPTRFFEMVELRKEHGPAPLQAPKYQSVERREEGDTVIVRYEFVGFA